MFMLGSIANAAAIAVAGIIGSFLGRGIPERIGKTVVSATALCVFSSG